MWRRQTELLLPGEISDPSLLEHRMQLIEAFENKPTECGKHGRATRDNDDDERDARAHIGEQKGKIVVRVSPDKDGEARHGPELKVQFHCTCLPAHGCVVVGTHPASTGAHAAAAGWLGGGVTGRVQTMTNPGPGAEW